MKNINPLPRLGEAGARGGRGVWGIHLWGGVDDQVRKAIFDVRPTGALDPTTATESGVGWAYWRHSVRGGVNLILEVRYHALNDHGCLA